MLTIAAAPTLLSHSEADTERFGRELTSRLQPGILVTLDGDLGAGKTVLAAAIAGALGVPRTVVQSPSYVLLRSYTEAFFPVYHWDFYRIADAEEIVTADFQEILLERSGLVIVEWASRFKALWDFFLPRHEIEITMGASHGTRHIKVISSE